MVLRNLVLSAAVLVLTEHAAAQFDTVINVPPDAAPATIGSNTQVNVFDGGEYFGIINAGDPDGTSTNVELNVFGGVLGVLGKSHGGSTVNISGGVVGAFFDANNGSAVNISGGSVGEGFDANSGSIIQISGGFIGPDFDGNSGSTVHVSGGILSDTFEAKSGSTLHLYGGDFRVNGVAVGGLETVGNSVPLGLGTFYVLSGTYADGTPFALANSDSDFIASSSITLHAASLPAIGPASIVASTDPVPGGIRAGQSLLVDSGGMVGTNFSAGWGSNVEIQTGGVVGTNFEASGASVEMSGGTIGNLFDAFFGSVVNISGGAVGDGFQVHGGTLNLSGGTVGRQFRASNAGVVNISGGSIGEQATVGFEGTVHITGGEIGAQFTASVGSQVHISGGLIHNDFTTVGATADISGGDFRLNGVPIAELANVGDSLQLNLPDAAVLTGTLADGTPFVFSQSGGEETFLNADSFAFGSLTLQTTAHPAATPFVKVASIDGVPLFVREEQTLIVDSLAVIPNNFIAARGSNVLILPGATIGEEFEAAGAEVVISGGSVAQLFNALGSTVTISGGTIGNFFRAKAGSTVTMTGGTLGNNVAIQSDSTFDLVGGSVGNFFSAGHFSGLSENVIVNISGGTVGNTFSAHHGSTVNITGGSVAQDFDANDGSTVNIAGGTVGTNFEANAGSVVNVSAGNLVGFLRAQAGSLVNVVGGTLATIEANGGEVNVGGGLIQGILYANDDGNVSVSGGEIVHDLIANSGGTVEITGGKIARLRANGGSVVSVAGGQQYLGVTAFFGSQLHIFGGDFRLGGTPIAGLESLGNSVPLAALTAPLTGTLADGTPVAFSENDFDFFANGAQVVLHAAALPAIGPAIITAPADPVPVGIRDGQTLIVESGGHVDDNFNAGWGSTVRVHAGGSIGENFEAAGATVKILGGSIGSLDAFSGTTVEIWSGTAGNDLAADFGSVIHLLGGSVGESATAFSGSEYNMIRGSVGDSFNANNGSIVNVFGGTIGSDFDADDGSAINLFGTQFFLDGMPIDGLSVNSPLLLTSRDATLTGTLLDGSDLSFQLNSANFTSQDFFHPSALLTLTQLVLGDYDRDADVDEDDYLYWKQHYGETVSPFAEADGNGDGRIDAADFTVWRNHLMIEESAELASNVPEPTTFWLGVLSFSLAVAIRWRR